ncbi:MAG TPA: C39 family peptidase [Mycobacteriales bacterium]|jgi:hypothetical protein
MPRRARRRLVPALAVATFVPLLVAAPAAPAAADETCVDTYETGYTCTPPMFEGMDPTPSTDLDAIDVPPTSVVLTKAEQTADYELQVANLLSTQVARPVPSDSENAPSAPLLTPCVSADDCGGGSAPANYSLPIVGKMQQGRYYCVPATAQMILATMGASTPSQATLASEMKTAKGTNLAYASKPLNRRQSRNYYQWVTDTSSAQHLMSRAVTDIWRYKSTYLVSVNVQSIGYYPAGWTGSHAVNNYAYYTQSGGGLYLFDPMNPAYTGGQSYYGKHNVKLATVYASNKANGWGLVW